MGFKIKLSTPLYEVKAFDGCWRCGWGIDVYAFISKTINVLDISEAGLEESGWRIPDGSPCLLSEITFVDENLDSYLKEYYPYYFLDYSKTLDKHYYMNHCHRCGAKQAESGLYHANGPLCPIDVKAWEMIYVRPLHNLCGNSFTANAEYAIENQHPWNGIGKWHERLDLSEDNGFVGGCPVCKGQIFYDGNGFRCENNDFKFPSNKLNSLGCPRITESQMMSLLLGHGIYLHNLQGKKGPFNAIGFLENNEKFGWGIKFDFDINREVTSKK